MRTIMSLRGAIFVMHLAFALGPALAFGAKAVPALPPSKGALKALFLADIHFNPLDDAAIAAKIAAAPASEWPKIFMTSVKAGPVSYFSETDSVLWRSAVADMQARVARPDLIVIAGDFLAHNFRTYYDKALPRGGDAGYASFVQNTLTYLAKTLMDAFPDAALAPVLGNNDSLCGNYMSEPSAPFLNAFAKTFAPGVNRRGGAPDFVNQFSAAGHYSMAIVPAKPGRAAGRLIVLNTIYLSERYRNSCTKGGSTESDGPALETLKRLNLELSAAQSRGEKVWVASHIPAGIDLNSQLRTRGDFCSGKVMTQFMPVYNSSFIASLRSHRGTVAMTLAGHTHMNEFRLYGGDSDEAIPALIAPSISPVYSNNPAYAVLEVDATTLAIRDEHVYRADLRADGKWDEESSFRAVFAQPDLSVSSLRAAFNSVKSDPKLRDRYLSRFNSGSPLPALPALNWPAYACGVAAESVEAFKSCVCR